MKIFCTSILLLLCFALFGQQPFRVISSGSPVWSTISDTTYLATINLNADQTGNSFNGTQLVDTFRVFTDAGEVYLVDSILSAFVSQVQIRVKEYGYDGPPTGQIMIYDPAGKTGVPQTNYGSIGSLAKIQQAVDTYNSRLVGTGSGGGGGGTADGVATAGTYSDITEQLSISVDAPGSDFDIDLTNVATDAAQADSMQVIRDSVFQHRIELTNLEALADTLQHVFEIATVADTVTIPDPKEGYQAITTDICATRLLYTGVYWSVLSGNVNTVPNVISSDYIGSSSGIEIPNSFSIFQEGVDSVSLRSFQRNGVELLSEEYLFDAAISSCTYASLETLLNADGATVTAYSDNSECDGAAIIDYAFTLYNFDSLTYIIGTDLVNDTVTLYPTAAEIDTFRIVLSAASVSDVVSISDNNTGVTVTLIDSVLQYIAIDTIASASVAVIFTYCNNASSTLTAILDFANNEIIPTLPLSSRPGTVNSVPVYSSPDVLNDPGLMTLENNRATLPREVRISVMTDENRPSPNTGLLGYNSTTGYFQASTGSTWFEVPKSTKSTFTNLSIPYSDASGALTESPSNLYFSNLALTVRATNNRTNINFGRTGSLTMSFQSGTTGFIMTPSGSGFPILQEEFNTGNWKYTNINRMTFSQTNSNIPSGFYVRRVSDATPIFCAGGGNDLVGFNGVGIGTFNPESKLDIVSGGNTSTTRAFRVRDSDLNPLFQIRDNGNVGIATTNPAYKLEIIGTGGIRITTGTTAERPTGAIGVIRGNSSRSNFEGYNGAEWRQFLDLPDTEPAEGAIPIYQSGEWVTGAQEVAQSYAIAYKTTTPIFTTTTIPDTIDGSWTSDFSDDFTFSSGVFTYVGSATNRYMIRTTASVEADASTVEYYLRIVEDGTVKAQASQYFATADAPESMTTDAIVVLTTGKTFYLTGSIFFGTTDIKFENLNISLIKL